MLLLLESCLPTTGWFTSGIKFDSRSSVTKVHFSSSGTKDPFLFLATNDWGPGVGRHQRSDTTGNTTTGEEGRKNRNTREVHRGTFPGGSPDVLPLTPSVFLCPKHSVGKFSFYDKLIHTQTGKMLTKHTVCFGTYVWSDTGVYVDKVGSPQSELYQRRSNKRVLWLRTTSKINVRI